MFTAEVSFVSATLSVTLLIFQVEIVKCIFAINCLHTTTKQIRRTSLEHLINKILIHRIAFLDTNTVKFSSNLEGGNFGVMVFGAIVCDLLGI